MTKQIVVQFMPDGTVAHTRDKNFDLSEVLGAKRSIQRMTDIKFNEDNQRFYVEFLRGTAAEGHNLIGYHISRDAKTGYFVSRITFAPALFDTYEEAVEAEVEVVNSLRLLGATF